MPPGEGESKLTVNGAHAPLLLFGLGSHQSSGEQAQFIQTQPAQKILPSVTQARKYQFHSAMELLLDAMKGALLFLGL